MVSPGYSSRHGCLLIKELDRRRPDLRTEESGKTVLGAHRLGSGSLQLFCMQLMDRRFFMKLVTTPAKIAASGAAGKVIGGIFYRNLYAWPESEHRANCILDLLGSRALERALQRNAERGFCLVIFLLRDL